MELSNNSYNNSYPDYNQFSIDGNISNGDAVCNEAVDNNDNDENCKALELNRSTSESKSNWTISNLFSSIFGKRRENEGTEKEADFDDLINEFVDLTISDKNESLNGRSQDFFDDIEKEIKDFEEVSRGRGRVENGKSLHESLQNLRSRYKEENKTEGQQTVSRRDFDHQQSSHLDQARKVVKQKSTAHQQPGFFDQAKEFVSGRTLPQQIERRNTARNVAGFFGLENQVDEYVADETGIPKEVVRAGFNVFNTGKKVINNVSKFFGFEK